MRRREFIALVGASVGWPFTALAQEPALTYRLGFLAAYTRDIPFHVFFLTVSDAVVSSKAKTSRSITAPLHRTLI
jgi:hypothetical protein